MTPVLETGKTAVALLTIDVMRTTVMIVITEPHLQTVETITEAAHIMTDVASLLQNKNAAKVIPQNIRSKGSRSSMLCTY